MYTCPDFLSIFHAQTMKIVISTLLLFGIFPPLWISLFLDKSYGFQNEHQSFFGSIDVPYYENIEKPNTSRNSYGT